MGLWNVLFSRKRQQHEWYDVYGIAFDKEFENPIPIRASYSIHTEKYRHGYLFYSYNKKWYLEQGSWTAKDNFPDKIDVKRYTVDTPIRVGYCLVGIDENGMPQHLVIENGMVIGANDPEYLEVRMEGSNNFGEYVETIRFKKSKLYVAMHRQVLPV